MTSLAIGTTYEQPLHGKSQIIGQYEVISYK